jgi:DNA-binding NtrC family response regulator
MSDEKGLRIWVVDRLDHWRTFAAGTLERAGFTIEAYGRYEEVLGRREPVREPDLVMLGCACAQAEERSLVAELARRGCPVVILSSTFSCDDLRSLFLAGASDVSRRPDTPDVLLSLVLSDLADLSRQRQKPRVWLEASL